MTVLSASVKAEAEIRKPRSNALPPPPITALQSALGCKEMTIDWLAGDGSDRCYYRIRSPQLPASRVLMQLSGDDARAIRAGRYDWIEVQKELEKAKIFTPKLHSALSDHAALIIEDYGDDMLESVVLRTDDPVFKKTLYLEAVNLAIQFLSIKGDNQSVWRTRAFDVERLQWELRFFRQKYLEAVLHLELSPRDELAFESDCVAISHAIAQHSRFFVHRDYHSRNIMVRGGELAVIDFQDARLGPPAYDLVSLAFDSYVPFSASERASLVRDGIDAAQRLLGEEVAETIMHSWKSVLLQRQLKAIGSFGYLTKDKGRGDYLKYVEPALKTLEDQSLDDERWPFISRTLLQRMREHL